MKEVIRSRTAERIGAVVTPVAALLDVRNPSIFANAKRHRNKR